MNPDLVSTLMIECSVGRLNFMAPSLRGQPPRGDAPDLCGHGHQRRHLKDEVNEALLTLCKDSILLLGYHGEEPTYKVSAEFAEDLTNCTYALLHHKRGSDEEYLELVALLALVSWYGKLTVSEAFRRMNALLGVLCATLEGER